MNLARFLERAARIHPDNPAVYHGDRLMYSYRELAERAARIAGYLTNVAGLQRGDRVALYMTNCPQYLETLYAIWWAGLVAVPVNAKLHPKEVGYILDDAQASGLLLTDDLASSMAPVIAEAPALKHIAVAGRPEYDRLLTGMPCQPQQCAPDDLAWLFYTSGTTGTPKGVMVSHRNLATMTACYLADVDEVSAEDATVYAAPMSHGAGLYSFPYVLKAARHVIPQSGGFQPEELINLSQTVGRLCLFAAPTMVKRLTHAIQAEKANSEGFKTIVYGGGPMYVADLKEALSVMGNRFVQIYGQGESPMTITVLPRSQLADSWHPRWEERIGSVGYAQSLVELKVVDSNGQPVPTGKAGEIIVRGDSVMQGYWQNPEATRKTLNEGWLWTGDMGALDQDGFLTLRDRSKDVIISGGSNIYPREVEEVLLMHPAVAEVSVVGRPSREWGEEVVAFVVCRTGQSLDPQALDACCLERIARFKRPKEYRFVASLPKNNYGKVLKTELRKML